MEVRLKEVYILSVEPPGDYIFTPSGVVFLMENDMFKIYCVSSSHNLYRGALHKHPWNELEQGVVFRDSAFRLENLTQEMNERGWTHAESIPAILEYLYTTNRKQLFFLAKHVETYSVVTSPVHPNIPPL